MTPASRLDRRPTHMGQAHSTLRQIARKAVCAPYFFARVSERKNPKIPVSNSWALTAGPETVIRPFFSSKILESRGIIEEDKKSGRRLWECIGPF